MTAEVFLDTNVLLYACSGVAEDAETKQRAGELILGGNFALSAQVLQEFIANALRKPALGIGKFVIDATLEMDSQVPVQPEDLEVVILSTILCRRQQLSHGQVLDDRCVADGDRRVPHAGAHQSSHRAGGRASDASRLLFH